MEIVQLALGLRRRGFTDDNGGVDPKVDPAVRLVEVRAQPGGFTRLAR
jgi:hypothetical protein